MMNKFKGLVILLVGVVSMVIVAKSEVRKIKSIERIIKKQFEQKTIPSGIEICEVQLMSLANKVHNTEVNHEIDTYLDNINTLFEDTDKDELIKKFFSVEFTRFYNYYKDSRDLTVSDSGNGGSRQTSSDEVRYFINVGKKDGYDWMSLKDFLKAVLDLGKDDVFKVDVKDSFSFFNTDKAIKDKVLNFFTDFKYNGRFVNVEITENKGRGKGGRRDGKRGKRDSNFRADRRSRRGASAERTERRSGKGKKGKRSASDRPRRSRRK